MPSTPGASETRRDIAAPRSSPPPVVSPGAVVAGYGIVRLLGTGGMGAVWEATRPGSADRVALKLLRSDVLDPAEASRFAREARLLMAVHSPFIARVVDVGVTGKVPYLAMELLHGEPLSAVLRREGRLPLERALDLFLQACAGVAAAHAASIVHRDLKPSNLFVVAGPGGAEGVTLLDFGIAKSIAGGAFDEATLTLTNTTLGTPGYLAPEQLRNAKSVDARADIWALGLTLFRMLAGTSPFPAESSGEYFAKILSEAPVRLRSILPDASAALEKALLRCMEKDPARRFASVAALARAVAPFAPARSAEVLASLVGGAAGDMESDGGDERPGGGAPAGLDDETVPERPAPSGEARSGTVESASPPAAVASSVATGGRGWRSRGPWIAAVVMTLAGTGAWVSASRRGVVDSTHSDGVAGENAPVLAATPPPPGKPEESAAAATVTPRVPEPSPISTAPAKAAADSASAAPGKGKKVPVSPRVTAAPTAPPPSPKPASTLPWTRNVDDP